MAEQQLKEQVKSFASGGVGGVCAVVVGHPFDLVKVRLQTAEAGVYKGAMDVVKRTVAREGLVRVRRLCALLEPGVADQDRVCTRACRRR